MKRALLAAFVLSIATSASAQTQFVRPSDPDIRGLISEVDWARGRFEDALDGKLKDSILRSPTGEVRVSRYLEDFQRNTSLVKERYKDDYAASQEVLTLLKQCTGLNTFVSNQQGAFKGRSEWDAMAVLLGNLAKAYGTAFPTPDGATARRMNDKEVAQAADSASRAAEEFRKAASKTMKTAKADPAAIASMEREMKALGASAKALKSQLSSHKASTNEARLLLEQATRVQTVVTPPAAPDLAAAHWDTLLKNLQSVRQAFGM